jgi:TRAP-type C4-dicarboxylate transport system permease large subunit
VLGIIYLVLGMAMDGISMIVLTTSIVLPMIQAAGFDLIWFGIFIVLLVEIGQITPPVGFNLFVLQTMSQAAIANYVAHCLDPLLRHDGAGGRRSSSPFPPLATWLPDAVLGVTR